MSLLLVVLAFSLSSFSAFQFSFYSKNKSSFPAKRSSKLFQSNFNKISEGIASMFGEKNLNLDSSTIESYLSSIENPEKTWNLLDAKIRKIEPKAERDNLELMASGRGGSNHKANLRLFDAPEGFEPEVTLYRDTAGWCPYCEKVWLQLEEKRIPYKVIKVPMNCYGKKPSSFYQISPGGGIPAAIIKGQSMTESNDIMMALEKLFPDNTPLFPPEGSSEYKRVSPLLKLERQVFSVWFRWLTSGSDMSTQMSTILQQVERELAYSPGPYFLGNEISIVDVMFTPFLERMAASLPYYKGFLVRDEKTFPNLFKWYEAMDQREAYTGLKSDYYTHCQDLPPQIGGCISSGTPEAKAYSASIDGKDWHLGAPSLEPLLPRAEDVAQREVVRSLVGNWRNVAKFCTRAVNKSFFGRTAAAPLADPGIEPNETLAPVLEIVLAEVAQLIMGSIEGDLENSKTITINKISKIPANLRPPVRESLIYLRDRVGVPRDMSVHAARQFRAHLNIYCNLL